MSKNTSMTSRKLVLDTLEFRGSERVPRHLWLLPWAEINHPDNVDNLRKEFPDDIVSAPELLRIPAPVIGSPTEPGLYVDAWGCRFHNLERGIIGEVKEPIVPDSDDGWDDTSAVQIPEEWLSLDIAAVNDWIRREHPDTFVLAGSCPHPFEQLQFIRGTESLFVDLMLKPPKMMDFISTMHEFYCQLLEVWARTDVDALTIMDDWGTQNFLLINPALWREIFAPLYRDYIDIAKKHGKKIFMHSDGYILDIIPDLIDMGLDALNCQVFCMGTDQLSQFAGRITFWGEIDRQHILPSGTDEEVGKAVGEIKKDLWKGGGCIAQCEFGPGANPANIHTVFEHWNALEAS